MSVYREPVVVTGATGGAGVATATANSGNVVNGVILAVYLTYVGTPPATTDITITEANNSPAMPVLTATNKNTDGWAFVNPGRAVNDYIKVTIAQANDADGVTATIVYLR